jgi:hypothetical protein
VAVPPTKAVASAGQASPIGVAGTVRGPSFNCNQSGHFSKFCPYPPKKKQQNYPARVHHNMVDEIPEGEPMTTGKFPSTNILQLFYLILDHRIHL